MVGSLSIFHMVHHIALRYLFEMHLPTHPYNDDKMPLPTAGYNMMVITVKIVPVNVQHYIGGRVAS
jgi:hypothetical protein